MLKFMLPCIIMLMPLVNSWWAVQSSLFILTYFNAMLPSWFE